MDCKPRRRFPTPSASDDSISSCSDDDDDYFVDKCPRKRRPLAFLNSCGPLRPIFGKLGFCFARTCSCLDPRNWTMFTTLLVLIPLFLIFMYVIGLPILRLILPESWLKSTATIVKEAIAKYNADKMGRADYALESGGGSILCASSTYYCKNCAFYSLFGVPLWYHSSTPRMVIQPQVQAGTCWAMEGTSGYVTIQLSMPVIITAVSLEHIPQEVSPVGRLDSAPKDIVVIAKEINNDSPEIPLGKFTYQLGKDPIQVFDVKEPYCTASFTNPRKCSLNQKPFSIVTLQIINNHGNPDFTCIYRFRVHGKPFFYPTMYEK